MVDNFRRMVVVRKFQWLRSKLPLHSLFCSSSHGVSTGQVNFENTPSTVSARSKRIGKIVEVVSNLTPHQAVFSTQEDASVNNDESLHHIRPANKYYTSFSYLKPVIEQALIENPRLSDGENGTSNTISVIKALHSNVGLGLKAITTFLRRNPEVFEMTEVELNNRIENLRSLKLKDGILQRTISRTPELLDISEGKINSVASYLTGDLDFTVKELSDLFLYSSQVFLDPLDVTDSKFQYIFFTMGYKQHDALARYGVMRYGLWHIRTRHLFLERRGQYQLPDKKGSLTIKNPKIRPAICSDDAYFCREVALCKLEEFKFFKKVLLAEDAMREEDLNADDRVQQQEFADMLLTEMS